MSTLHVAPQLAFDTLEPHRARVCTHVCNTGKSALIGRIRRLSHWVRYEQECI